MKTYLFSLNFGISRTELSEVTHEETCHLFVDWYSVIFKVSDIIQVSKS